MKNIALLIDAENISYKSVPLIFNKLSNIGKISIKRVYGDFTAEQLKPWSDTNNEYSLLAIHQPNYVSGKNTSDIRITMDTMKLLFENKSINAFALASSDSDFTPLVQYLTEKGYSVYGFGDSNKTKSCFANACSQFFDVSKSQDDEKIDLISSSTDLPLEKIYSVIEECAKSKNAKKGGFAYLGDIGTAFRDANIEIKGYKTLGKLFDKNIEFQVYVIGSNKFVRKFDFLSLTKRAENILKNKKDGLSFNKLASLIKEQHGTELFLRHCTAEDIEKRLKSINHKNFVIKNDTINF